MKLLSDHLQLNGISLGLINDADIDATVKMINLGYKYQDEAKGRVRITADELRKQAKEKEFYVAKENGKVVACLYIKEKDEAMFFGLLVVAEEKRGTVLAPNIIRAVEGYASGAGFKRIELEYWIGATWLKTYYEKFGFKQLKETVKWGELVGARMVKEL